MDLQFSFYKDGRRNSRINRICGFELIEFLRFGVAGLRRNSMLASDGVTTN